MSGNGSNYPQIDISKRPKDDGKEEYKSHGITFTVTKDTTDVPGFFRHVHKPDKEITLNGKVQDESKIGTGIPIEKVKEVYVYYWNGEPSIPILLRIKQNKERATEYYGKFGASSWFSGRVENMTETQALDHQNCDVNKVVPVELLNPENPANFLADNNRSNCLKGNSVNPSFSGLPTFSSREKSIYEAKSYKILWNKGISRVTYDNNPTDIVPPYNSPISHLRIYKWEDSNNPLIVEFKKSSGESDWYENLGQDPSHTKWKKINSQDASIFYNSRYKLTDDFTKKLDEVNCEINNVVQIDIRKQPDNKIRYCHGRKDDRHIKKISVEPDGNVNIPGFVAYKHYMKGYNKFNISGFNGDLTLKGFSGLPFRDVTEVIVFSSRCSSGKYGRPIVIYVDHKDGTKNKWYQKKSPLENVANDWEEMPEMNEKLYNSGNIQAIKKKLDDVAKGFDSPCVERRRNRIQTTGVGRSSGQSQPYSLESYGAYIVNNQVSNGIQGETTQNSESEEAESEEDTNQIPSSQPTFRATSSLGVTIDIQRSTNGGGQGPDTYTSGGSDQVSLTKIENPPGSGFWKFKHQSPGGSLGRSLNVQKVMFGGSTVSDIGVNYGEEIQHLTVWYWSGDNNMLNPLFIEVNRNGKIEYHFNKGGVTISWSPYKQSLDIPFTGEPLERILNKLNCQHNVVQIDLTRLAGEYCHEGDSQINHANKKVKVTQISHVSELGNYTAYEHIPNLTTYAGAIDRKFDVSAFKKGDTTITLKDLKSPLPLKNAIRVVVYFCKEEISGNTAKNPLLFYIDSNSPKYKWFKKSYDTMFEALDSGVPNDATSYAEIIKILDSLESQCKPPEVTIDVYQRSIIGANREYYDYISTKFISVRLNRFSDATDFAEYFHTIPYRTGSYFTLKQVDYKGNSTGIVTGWSILKVVSVSVFYWTSLETYSKDTSRPLLVKVATKAHGGRTEEKYYENNGDPTNVTWGVVHENLSQNNHLRKKLELLNCKLNAAVIIDISQKPTTISTDNYDACDYNDKRALGTNHGNSRIKVYKDSPIGAYEVYKHVLNLGGMFHIVGLKNDSSSITLNGLGTTPSSPILGVDEFRVYFCPKGPTNPLLIYYRKIGGTSEHNWHKNENPDTIAGLWQVVTGSIQNTYNDQEIQKVLDGLNSRCKLQAEAPKVAPTTPKGESLTQVEGTQSGDGNGGQASPDETTTSTSESTRTEGSPDPQPAQAVTGLEVVGGTVGLGSIISGVFGGSGVAFFGGWKLYNRYKGDPWVRQI